MKKQTKNSKQMLFEMLHKLNPDSKPILKENYPMGAEFDPNAPWNQKDDGELWDDEEPKEPEEFDDYDRYRDDKSDGLDENPDDSIDSNNPHHKIGELSSMLDQRLEQVQRLYKFLDKNPPIPSIKGFIESMLNGWEKELK